MATFTQAIQSSNDNGSKFGSGSSWTTTYVQMGLTISTGSASGAFRFTGVTIPAASTITSAKITWYPSGTYSADRIILQIAGIDEDNTADFSSSPLGRTKTTATVTGYHPNPSTNGVAKDTPSLTAIVQEIVDRAGWSSGNAMGFIIEDNGGTADNTMNWSDYNDPAGQEAVLTIDYAGNSPSPSITPSSSISLSPSSSTSPSSSFSASSSFSPSASPSPSAAPTYGTYLRVAKSGVNALTNSDPEKMKFDSAYGTLKYYTKQTKQVTFTAGAPDNYVSGSATYTHSLGYYPFTEVFVRVYIGSPSGNYEYCPFFGSGASVAYSANYKITTTDIVVYGSVDGVSSSTWVFDFLIFVYKNDLNL
jgi:hypothetical protein